MTSLKTEVLLQEFFYNSVRIPDPAPEMTVEQVRDLLTPNYPEIATASVAGPEDTAPNFVTPSAAPSGPRARRCLRQ
jgi:PRTRC genetic system protein C